MAYKASGTIIAVMPTAHGTTKNGKDWEKQECVLEISDKYHTKMKFSIYSWDGPIETPLKTGDNVEISFMVEARESKGNWFNEVKAYRVEHQKQ
ncbi:DUF3127 domain-containing protein [Bacteroides faecis]|uniref:DUF3127 domain-containing protein n=1 Tax=Bacteroides faecis TaxID=674529 RepID=UPI00356973AC